MNGAWPTSIRPRRSTPTSSSWCAPRITARTAPGTASGCSNNSPSATTTPAGSAACVVTDSRYLHDGMTSWLAGWKKRGWRTAGGDPVKNQDLWQQLAALSANHKVAWEWVRGHDGHPFNERCDRLAKRAAEEGMRATTESDRPADQAGERERNETAIPTATAPAPVRTGEEINYEADEDGQFVLC